MESVSIDLAAKALQQSIMRHWSRYGRVSVEYVTIELRCVRSVIGVVSEQRVVEAEDIFKYQLRKRMQPYSPVIYTNTEGGNAVAFGPLVEQNGNEFVLLDGVHRCLAAMRCGADRVRVAMVHAERTPPPVARPVPLSAVSSVTSGISGSPIFEGKGIRNFRPSSLFVGTAADSVLKSLGRAMFNGAQFAEYVENEGGHNSDACAGG